MDYKVIEAANAWLDRDSPSMDAEGDNALRIIKLCEEVGEVALAYIEYTGPNPRKGQTRALADVLDELADVAVTAICAIQHFTGDTLTTQKVVRRKMKLLEERVANSAADHLSGGTPPLSTLSPKSGTVPRQDKKESE